MQRFWFPLIMRLQFGAFAMCFAVTAHTQTPSIRALGIDAECEQQLRAVAEICNSEAAQVTKACSEKNAATRCGKEGMDHADRCMEKRLSSTCRAQWRSATQKAAQKQ